MTCSRSDEIREETDSAQHCEEQQQTDWQLPLLWPLTKIDSCSDEEKGLCRVNTLEYYLVTHSRAKKNEQARVRDSWRVLESGFVSLHVRFAFFVIAWLRSSVKRYLGGKKIASGCR